MVHGKNKKHLDQLLATLYIEGAQPVVIEEVLIKPAPDDMVMPSDFYRTTNNSTQIYYSNEWIDVRKMMMDKCIAIDIKLRTAECKMIREVRKGDMIVVEKVGFSTMVRRRIWESSASLSKAPYSARSAGICAVFSQLPRT